MHLEACGGRRLRQWPYGQGAERRAGPLQRGTASSDFLRASSMRSRRRCLMLSSTWLQKRRKYWAAETSALTTTSQSKIRARGLRDRSEEHTSELQSRLHLVCRLLLEKKKQTITLRIRDDGPPQLLSARACGRVRVRQSRRPSIPRCFARHLQSSSPCAACARPP